MARKLETKEEEKFLVQYFFVIYLTVIQLKMKNGSIQIPQLKINAFERGIASFLFF
jgi:hypothetical protein